MKNDTTVEKKVKTKKKHKVDWKMLYPITGILLFGALALIAFVSMGFGVKDSTTVLGVPGSLLIPIGNLTDHNPTYGATVAGIVIAWITIIVPFVMMFWSPNRKLTQWLGIIPMVFTVLAAVLMFAGIGLFIRDFKSFDPLLATYKINGGAIAGIVVILVVGWLIALAGITRGFFNFNFWTAKMLNKTNKGTNPQPATKTSSNAATTASSSTTNPKLNDQTINTKPIVQQEPIVADASPLEPNPVLSEIDDDQTITIGAFNQSSPPIK